MNLVRIGLILMMLMPAVVVASDLIPLDDVALQAPASAVARLHNGTGRYCTAVLVAPDMAVTAAHCLFDQRSSRWIRPHSIHILLGYDRGDFGFHTTVKAYRTGDYDPRQPGLDLENDWALMRLTNPAPVRYANLEPPPTYAISGRPFRSIGFAAPRRYALSQTPECHVSALAPVIVSDCPTSSGMSGAPLIDPESGMLVGIQIGSAVSASGQPRLVAVPASSWADAPKP